MQSTLLRNLAFVSSFGRNEKTWLVPASDQLLSAASSRFVQASNYSFTISSIFLTPCSDCYFLLSSG
jgi:hypothetical protein